MRDRLCVGGVGRGWGVLSTPPSFRARIRRGGGFLTSTQPMCREALVGPPTMSSQYLRGERGEGGVGAHGLAHDQQLEQRRVERRAVGGVVACGAEAGEVGVSD